MDASSLINDSQHQKLNEANKDQGLNNICNLPNAMLLQIISLLPTNEAIKTSILSKRWKYLWTSIPNFDFHATKNSSNERMLFMDFVDRAFVLRDFSDIRRFTLSCSLLKDASRINEWIATVVRLKVKYFELRLSNMEEEFVLPSCLFTCGSLKKLRIEMYGSLKLPPTIWFPTLRSLSFKNIVFPDDLSTEGLFCNCHVLEELSIDECLWKNLKTISISFTNLKRLNIVNDYSTTEDSSCRIMILAMNLESFEYVGDLSIDYCLHKLTSLAYASFNIVSPEWLEEEVGFRLSKILGEISHVKELKLLGDSITFLDAVDPNTVPLPMFNNLTNLALFSLDVDLDRGALLAILNNCPLLTSLAFPEGILLSKNCRELNPMPPCFLASLEEIQISDFRGEGDEVYAVEVLLKSARLLKRITIYTSLHYIHQDLEGTKEALHKQLNLLLRASSSCELFLL